MTWTKELQINHCGCDQGNLPVLKVLNPPFVGSTPARGGFLLKCTFGCAVTVVDGGNVIGNVGELDVDSTAIDSTAVDSTAVDSTAVDISYFLFCRFDVCFYSFFVSFFNFSIYSNALFNS